MKLLIYVLFFLNFVMLGIMWTVLPNEIATKFNLDGTPTGGMGVVENVILMGCVLTFLLALQGGMHYLLGICPAYGFNVPYEKYWKTEENFPKLRAITQKWMQEFWCGLFLMFFLINGGILLANLRRPPHAGWELGIIVGLFFLFTIVWTARLFWILRPPSSAN